MEHHLLLAAMELQQNATLQGHHHPGAGLGEAGRKGLAAQVILLAHQKVLALHLAQPKGYGRSTNGRISRLG